MKMSNYESKYYDQVDETVHKKVMDNGLEVYIIDKKGYNKKFVTYTTKYGSTDNHFKTKGKVYNVPDGIAHFLEHKMFDKESEIFFNKFPSTERTPMPLRQLTVRLIYFQQQRISKKT